jgi:predicted secreted hydrolase
MSAPLKRRAWLAQAAATVSVAAMPSTGGAAVPPGVSLRPLEFPEDHGAHPDTRIEWWYVTGWLGDATAATATATAALAEPRFGFQLTFFRSRTGFGIDHPSAFAAQHLILAHAALTDLRDPAQARQRHDQRIARAGLGLAQSAVGDCAVGLGDWQLRREGIPSGSTYHATLRSTAERFALDLQFTTTQPLLAQGRGGFSQKGPRPEQASHYYSEPQLAARGTVQVDGQRQAVAGRAWLDHEWSNSLLGTEAVGWDWIGINLQDGSALTAFRLRRADGSAVWAGGSFRRPGGVARSFTADEVQFSPGRVWASPATGARYPVEWTVTTPAGRHTLRALLDAQELDSRASTGTVYWEGLSELQDARGARIGLGYLEMTGYAGRLAL